MNDDKRLVSLERLLEKYRALVVLRAAREGVESAGGSGFEGPEISRRTGEFQRIAREFPGSLRELEGSDVEVLRRKARAIEDEIIAVREGGRVGRPLTPWIAIVLDYHAHFRESLDVKAWLSARIPRGGVVTPEIVAEFLEREPSRSGPLRDVAAARAYLETHRRPPGGRLHAIIWKFLEEKHGLPRRDLERAVFGVDADRSPE